MLAWFVRDPARTIEAMGHIVDTARYGAGTILNKLYEEEAADAFCEHTALFLEAIDRIQERHPDDPSIFQAFNREDFLPVFASFVRGEIGFDEMHTSLLANR